MSGPRVSGILRRGNRPRTVKGAEETETVKDRGCRDHPRSKWYGTSGRHNRQPRCGKNPEAGRPGKPTAARRANKTQRLDVGEIRL